MGNSLRGSRTISWSSMRLSQLHTFFDTSPAIRLLQAQNAPFILDFLKTQFKDAARLAIPHSDLHAALASYAEQVHDSYSGRFTAPAGEYLAEWCSPDSRWLRRHLA